MTKMPFFICPKNYRHRVVENEKHYSFQILLGDNIHHETSNLSKEQAIKMLVTKCVESEMV